jgi:hypothetical protein
VTQMTYCIGNIFIVNEIGVAEFIGDVRTTPEMEL